MNKILLENKMQVLERLVLQDIVTSYGKQNTSETSYDELMAKLLDRMTRFYEELELDEVLLQRLNQYGDRANIYTEQLREDLDETTQVTMRQIVKQLPREKLSGGTQWDLIQAVWPVLKRRMEALSNLLSASALQMKNYMLLWDYQDMGFTHYCLLTEGENCDDCNKLEGQIFPISEARVGENFAPMHPNCHCRVGILDEENRVIAIIAEGEEHEIEPDDKTIKNWLDSISDLLTAASLVPGLDTFTNLASIPVDLARGDLLSAGFSVIGAILVIGEVADTAKLARMADKAVDAAKTADKVSDVGKAVVKMPKLPKTPAKLKNSGWKETTSVAMKKNTTSRTFTKDGLTIRFDKGKQGAGGYGGKDHYHILNPKATGKHNYYLDKYGNPVPKNSKASHILP